MKLFFSFIIHMCIQGLGIYYETWVSHVYLTNMRWMIPPRASEAKRHFLTSLFLTHAVSELLQLAVVCFFTSAAEPKTNSDIGFTHHSCHWIPFLLHQSCTPLWIISYNFKHQQTLIFRCNPFTLSVNVIIIHQFNEKSCVRYSELATKDKNLAIKELSFIGKVDRLDNSKNLLTAF
jgi:hypothetical protein